MIDKIRSKIKDINPKSPVVIAALSFIILVPVIFVILSIPSEVQNQQESSIQPTQAPLVPGEDYVQGQIVVKFKEPVSESVIQERLVSYNARIIDQIPAIGVTVLEVPKGREKEIVNKLTQDGIVEYSELDYLYKEDVFTPNDPEFRKQWGLKMIKAPEAWDITKGNGVKIAIIDGGFDSAHPDLSSKIIATQNPRLSDHGTHTAGIAAAVTNNGRGIVGACPDCQLLVASGIGASTGSKHIIWATDNGAKVVSMSWGGDYFSQTLQNAIDYSWGRGVVLVASAGNDNNSIKHYPGANDKILSVASTDSSDKKSSFSSYGTWVDITGPGSSILSTLPGGTYGNKSGTSMSTPMVAGVVALIWSTPYGTSPDAVVKRICDTSDKISGTGKYWQCGRVNAQAAVGAGVSPSPSAAPTQPQPSITTVPTAPPVTPIPSGAVPTIVCGGSPDNVCGLPSPLPSGSMPPSGGNPPLTQSPNNPLPTGLIVPTGVSRPTNPTRVPDTKSLRRQIYERINQMVKELNRRFPFLKLKLLS